ncbi:MAG TPA: circularly permuted type 2 ATP-grasp protein [Candidatus Acidoferrales bacterium]|nr:circularly permuted type 2 ATP-grasp protein [Candidatus Acidoferrales bacterium]
MTNAAPLFGEEALGRYDEMLDRAGAVRPHWRQLAASFAAMAPDEYRHRLDSAMRMVHENGVTYNVYDEASGLARLWQLDIAPFIVSTSDWAAIEAAVSQRARLANAILHDIYGDQRLVRNGVVPAQLVLGHPQYLRALQGCAPPDGVHVHLYSVDLARASDGSWTVLASRADAPTGLGYALENRVVVSQTFPELFGELGVQHLASFFARFRDAVTGLARGATGHAVLLTPGPYNEAYFEHAYLARYLGLELVEGDDLAVRDGAVYLRTLGGLARVSVIFRRLDSDFADPLELRADSALGVPGLVDVIRAGNVVVANALGGGVVESPALDAYLPNISRALFGEELLIADIPTVWCGTAWGRSEGLSRVRRGIIRNAFDAGPLFSRGSSARLGSDLSAEEINAFADDVERRGATLVVEDVVPLGVAPTFEGGAFVSRPMSLRVFAAWTPTGYIVMPGGLARIAADDSVRALSMQSGAASKDVWALSEGPVDTFSLLPPPRARIEIRRSGNEAPSRAMDNLFWLARYAERMENLIRVLRAVVARLAGDTGITTTMNAVELARRLLLPLEHVTGGAIDEATAQDDSKLRSEVAKVIFGSESGGLQRLLRRIARAAWAARDRLSLDTWRAIYALTTWDPRYEPVGTFDGAGARAYLDMLIRRSAALSGLTDENMTRGNNWLFFDLGRRIERAFSACLLIRHTLTVADERESAAIQLALEIADSAMTYSYRYRNAFQPAPAIDLLLLDESNPRAVAFQIEAIVRHTAELPLITSVQQRGRARALADAVKEKIFAIDAYLLAETNAAGERTALIALLDDIEGTITRIAEAVGDAYLQHLPRYRA